MPMTKEPDLRLGSLRGRDRLTESELGRKFAALALSGLDQQLHRA